MPPTQRTTIVVPSGHVLGHFSPAGGGDAAFAVRIGWGVAELSRDEFIVWSQSYGVLPDVNEKPWTEEMVEEASVAAGVAEPAPVVDKLVSLGLLSFVELNESAVEFAKTHRIFPLLLGLGNTSDNPHVFTIGLPEAAAASVPFDLYRLWSRAHLEENLWEGCRTVAEENTRAGVKESQRADPMVILGDAMASLHTLLAVSCLYVDVTVDGRETRE